MFMADDKLKAMSMGFRRKGRPRVATQDVVDNGYKDPNGQYVLPAGLKPWHERVVDTMIANPNFKIVDLARAFNVTPQWMGALLRTDAFKQYYHERMIVHRQMIDATVVGKLSGLMESSLDKLQERVNADAVTFAQAKDAADLALRGLGYLGQMANPGTVNVSVRTGNVQQNVMFVPDDLMEAARKKLQERMQLTEAEDTSNAFLRVTSVTDLDVAYAQVTDLPDEEAEEL
jgi:hypothetical protein